MPDPRPRLARRCGALLLALAAGCAPAAPLSGPPLVRLDEAAVLQLAEVIRVEDRREYDLSVLERALGAPQPAVRRQAALTLGRLRVAGALPRLVQLTQDPDTAVAATAAFGLGQLGDTAAVAALLPLLAPEAARRAPTVAAEAAAALGKLPSASAARGLVDFLRHTTAEAGRAPAVEQALLAAWRHPRQAIPATVILPWTGAGDPEVRWRAVYALVRRPDPVAAPRLLELAADVDARVRAHALRGLTAPLADSAGLATADVLPVVLRATHDSDYATTINAVRSLGTYADSAAIARLIELLDAEPARAVAAAESLGRLGAAARGSATVLERVARDAARPVGVRSAALTALAQVAADRAAVTVGALAGEPDWRVRAAAGRALAALAVPPSAEVAALVRDHDPRVGAVTLQAAVEANRANLAPLRGLLLESLGAADVQLRTAALTGLARLRDPATLPAVLDAYERAQGDTLNDAALAALDALGALREAGVPAASAFLRRFGRAQDYLVRQRAVATLGDAVRSAWGDPLPIDTGRGVDDYAEIVRRWVAPALAGRPLPRARILTAAGAIELELFAVEAPLTVLNFLHLADAGYFDGQEWPRVVPNFVIQGGDPRGDQSGGPGYAIRDEINRHRYHRGTLGMALSGPETGGSQFFITHSPQPHLDGGYTVFGRVVSGMEVVDRVVMGERIASIRSIR